MNAESSRSLRVAVTGGAGRLGQQVIRELLEHGHSPICIDQRTPDGDPRERRYPIKIADLTNLGETYGMLRGADAVVHTAAIAWAGRHAPEVTYRTNTLAHFNVLEACAGLGIRKIATASSIQIFVQVKPYPPLEPLYFPIDEEHPIHPNTEYGLSKEAGEAANRMYARRFGISAASIRLPFIVAAERFSDNRTMADDVQDRNFWSYIDPRDAARIFRLAIETPWDGAEAFNACAADTCSPTPTARLLERYHPSVERRKPLAEFETLIAIDKARQRLGFEPRYTWRQP